MVLLAPAARKWLTFSAAGEQTDEGPLQAPDGFRIVRAAPTDSGRIFVHVHGRGSSGVHAQSPVCEIEKESGEFTLVEIRQLFDHEPHWGYLLGAERDDLVFLDGTSPVTNNVLRVQIR